MLNNKPLAANPLLNNIVYILKQNCYSVLFLKNNEQIILQDSLQKLESSLPKALFIRTHKSYIINLSEVIEFYYKKNNLYASLSNGNTAPISRRRRKEIFKNILVIS